MIVRFSLLALVAAISLALLQAVPAPDASALVTPVATCDAKHGVQRNKGNHPLIYPPQSLMQITLGNPDSNGFRDIELNGTDPVVDLSGTVDPQNWITASAEEPFSGFPTSYEFTGRLGFYDNAPNDIRVVGGYTLIGGDGGLPGGEPIGFLMFCPTDPENGVGDQDHDGHPAKILTNTGWSGAITADYDPPADVELIYRDAQDDTHQVTMPNNEKLSIIAEIDAVFEALAERRYNDARTAYGGAWNFSRGDAQIKFPAALGGVNVDGVFAGNLVGTSAAYLVASGNIGGFDIQFNGLGVPANFLGNAATTGMWRLHSPPDPDGISYGGLYDYGSEVYEEEYDIDFDANTGEVDVTLTLLFDSPNLRLAPSGSSAAGTDEIGDPIPMTVTIRDIPVAPLVVFDNCPAFANASQIDTDGDAVGDICEGFFWGDPTCDGFAALLDALDTLRVQSGATGLTPRPGCPHFSDIFGDIVFGDWNCDGSMTPLDAIILIARRTDATRPAPIGGCPDIGDFVEET